MGRLTKDPEIRYSQGERPMCVARYTLAVDREYKQQGQPSADFINCIAFGKNAEFVENYMKKGMKVAVKGRIQTGNYTDKNGNKVYTTDVIAEKHYFCESKYGAEFSNNGGGIQPPMPSGDNSFMDVNGIDTNDLPFT